MLFVGLEVLIAHVFVGLEVLIAYVLVGLEVLVAHVLVGLEGIQQGWMVMQNQRIELKMPI